MSGVPPTIVHNLDQGRRLFASRPPLTAVKGEWGGGRRWRRGPGEPHLDAGSAQQGADGNTARSMNSGASGDPVQASSCARSPRW